MQREERRYFIFYCIHEAAFGEEGIAPGFLVRQSYNELFFLCFLKKNSSFLRYKLLSGPTVYYLRLVVSYTSKDASSSSGTT